MSNVNLGNQELLWDFRAPATSAGFNRLLRHLIKPGVYKGGTVNIVTGTTVQILPLEAFINTQLGADDNLGCHIKTNLPFTISIPQTNPGVDEYIYMKLDWLNTIENWVDFLHRSVTAPPVTNEVIVARLSYTAGNVTGISYIDKTWGIIDVSDNNNVVIENALKIIDSGTPPAPGVGAALIYKKPGDTNIWLRSEGEPERLLGGGSGTGDVSRLLLGFNDSPYRFAAQMIFETDHTDLLDIPNTTAVFLNDKVSFAALGQYLTTKNLVGDSFVQESMPIDQMKVLLEFNTGLQDHTPPTRVTKDGGASWADVPMKLLGMKEGPIDVIESYSNQDTVTVLNISNQQALAQGFQIAQRKAWIKALSLQLRRVGTPNGRIKFQIRTDASGLPSTTILAETLPFNMDALPITLGLVELQFPNPALILAGTQYHMVMVVDNVNEYDFVSTLSQVEWGIESTGAYANGQASTYNGTIWSGSSSDHVFQVIGSYLKADSNLDLAAGDITFTRDLALSRNKKLYGYLETNGDANRDLNATSQRSIAQKVKFGEDHVIGTIDIRCTRTGTPNGFVQVLVCADDGTGKPGATISASNKTLVNDIATSENYVRFRFDGGLELLKDTVYWLVIQTSTSAAGAYSYVVSTNLLSLRFDESAPTYSQGGSSFYNGTIWSTEDTAKVMIFKVNGVCQDEKFQVLYDSSHDAVAFAIDNSTNQRLAQSFQTTWDTAIEGVELELQRLGTPGGRVYIEIRSNLVGSPGTLLSDSEYVDTTNIDTSAVKIRFALNSKLMLTKNTTYWIVLRTDSGYVYSASVNEIRWFRDATTPDYAFGNATYNGSAWSATSNVFVFSVRGVEAEVYLYYINSYTAPVALIGLAIWFSINELLEGGDLPISSMIVSASQELSGSVPYGGLIITPGIGELEAVVNGASFAGGIDFIEGQDRALFPPGFLTEGDKIVFRKHSQQQIFTHPELLMRSLADALPKPRITQIDVETIRFTADVGLGIAFALPNGIRVHGSSLIDWSFNPSKNKYGGLGLDIGTEASNVTYYLYAVRQSGSRSSLGIVASTIRPDQGGPAGYQYWKVLARFYNDGSGNILFPFLSEVFMVGGAVYSGTNTYIPWFNSPTSSYLIGDEILYTNDSLGSRIQVSKPGILEMRVRWNMGDTTGSGPQAAISRNSTSLSSPTSSTPSKDIFGQTGTYNSQVGPNDGGYIWSIARVVAYPGDIFRPHTNTVSFAGMDTLRAIFEPFEAL